MFACTIMYVYVLSILYPLVIIFIFNCFSNLVHLNLWGTINILLLFVVVVVLLVCIVLPLIKLVLVASFAG